MATLFPLSDRGPWWTDLASRTAVTRTIRLDGDTDRALSGLAEKERVSVNFLVNRALRKFIEWDVYAEKFGFLSLPASMITKMMSYLSDEEAKEMGRWPGRTSSRTSSPSGSKKSA